MRRIVLGVMATVLVGCMFAAAATFPLNPEKAEKPRFLAVTRAYSFTGEKGKKLTVAIPAVMSFWGATDQQVVLQNDFKFSVEPDSMKLLVEEKPFPARLYELTWNSAPANAITVTNTLNIERTNRSQLRTVACLPYVDAVKKAFPTLLATTPSINVEHEKVSEVAKGILTQASSAEEAVELACDWINDNIKARGHDQDSNRVLATMSGDPFGMVHVAAAICRKMGIPADLVRCETIVDGSKYAVMEAYFPDAGWVFYDLGCATRGFAYTFVFMRRDFRIDTPSGSKSADCSINKTHSEGRYFIHCLPTKLREAPKRDAYSVTVLPEPPAADDKIRHTPVSRVYLDQAIEPGVREYVRENPPPGVTVTAATRPSKPMPASQAAPATTSQPASAPKPSAAATHPRPTPPPLK